MTGKLAYTGLAEAIEVLRRRRDGDHAAAGRMVTAALRRYLRQRVRVRRLWDRWEDDALQEGLLRVLVGKDRERNDREAAAYLRLIARSVACDELRGDTRRGEVTAAGEDGAQSLVELLAAPTDDEPEPVPVESLRERLDEALDILGDYVTLVIDEAALPPDRVDRVQLQARACVMARCRKLGSDAIAAALERPEATRDSINQWTRRGRDWVLTAFDRWMKDAAPTEHGEIVRLRALVDKQRVDAGKARPARRKAATDTVDSVAAPPKEPRRKERAKTASKKKAGPRKKATSSKKKPVKTSPSRERRR